MSNITLYGLAPMWPELFLAIGSMIVLILGVLQKTFNATRMINRATIGLFGLTLLILISQTPDMLGTPILNGMFVQNEFTFFIKLI